LAPSTGRYTCRCGLYSDTTFGTIGNIEFYLNGVTTSALTWSGLSGNVGNQGFWSLEAARTFNLTAGDYIQCFYYMSGSITMTAGKTKSFLTWYKESW